VLWKAKLYFVYFGLMALGIGSAISQIRCPFIIKKHADAADYVRVDGDTKSDAQISVIAHIVRTQHDTSAPLDEHRADVMRRWYRENSMAHPISRYAVSVHFIAGTAILAIPSILAAIKIIALGLRRL
jgi:hypothetical protein